MVVLGVVLEVGGQVDDRHSERLDPELGPGPLERSEKTASISSIRFTA